MKEGTSIAVVRDENTPPVSSRNTRLVAAWLACGGRFVGEGSFSDTVEALPAGPKRVCTWLIDASHEVEFKTSSGVELVGFVEFRKRYESQQWCDENLDHHIAYLRAGNEHHGRLVDKIKTLKPMILIRKGKRIAIVPSGSDAASTALREDILAKF